MIIYTFSEARQNFAKMLKEASENGMVIIKRQDGSRFEVRPYLSDTSPLDVEGINIDISRRDIVEAVHHIREH